MKSWIARLRISAALDADQPSSAWLRQKTSDSAEGCGLEREMLALDRVLRGTAPRVEAPASLHQLIMQAVRTASRPATAQRQATMLRWLPAPVLAALVVAVAFWALHGPVGVPPHEAQPLAAATTALQLGNHVVRTMPSAVVAPLSDELARLNQDLDKTAQFLLASLP